MASLVCFLMEKVEGTSVCVLALLFFVLPTKTLLLSIVFMIDLPSVCVMVLLFLWARADDTSS